MTETAQRLLAWERTRPYGELLQASLADVPSSVRESLILDGRIIETFRPEVAARKMAESHGLDWSNMQERAQEYWAHRVKVGLGLIPIESPRFVSAEEYTQRLLGNQGDRSVQRQETPLCKGCQRPILFAKHWQSGKWMALDPEPHVGYGGILLGDDGLAYVFRDYTQAVQAVERAPVEIVGVGMAVHAATCPVVAQQEQERAEAREKAERERVGGVQMGLGI